MNYIEILSFELQCLTQLKCFKNRIFKKNFEAPQHIQAQHGIFAVLCNDL